MYFAYRLNQITCDNLSGVDEAGSAQLNEMSNFMPSIYGKDELKKWF